MSKGIIILNEIPEKCDQCLVRHPGLAYCQIVRKSTSHSSTGKHMNEKKRPEWCPIRPLPAQYSIGMATTPILEEAWINRAQGITENQRR